MRRILTILSFILLTTITSQAQTSRSVASDPSDRIVKLYPNPARDYVTFDLQRNYTKGLAIEVFNFLGKKMHETQNVPEKTTIDLADYNRGIYVYHLRDASGKIIESGKFQVTK